MKTPTLDQFKRWSADIAPAAKAVLMARVFEEMERERVNAYIRPIFDRYQFQYGDIWTKHGGAPGPVPDVDHLYLVDDGPELAAFYADCDDAHKAHGFTGPAGHWPNLVAQTIRIQAENALIGLARDLFGVDVHHLHGENRAKYLELMIGACVASGRMTSEVRA